jgi:hypothetical protein
MMSVLRWLAPLLVLLSALHSTGAAAASEALSHQHRHLTAVGRGGGFGGFSRPSTTSRPSSTFSKPATTAPAIGTPVTTAIGRPVAPAGRAYGSTTLPGGFSSYGRPGFRSTPFILPLALGSGLLAAGAISTLNRNPNAYCNGITVQCYKAACEDALRNR